MTAAEWIAKRRELLAAASEGPWFQDADDPGLVWGEQRSDGDGYWSLFASETGHDAAAQPSDAALIADARTSLPRALDALEAARGLAKGHRDFVTKRGRDDCICTICDMCRAIETALGGES